MSNETLNLIVYSTSGERFSTSWHDILESTLLNAGVAAVNVGGGTDLSTDQADNDYEITGSAAALDRALQTLVESSYSFDAFTLYGEKVRSNYV